MPCQKKKDGRENDAMGPCLFAPCRLKKFVWFPHTGIKWRQITNALLLGIESALKKKKKNPSIKFSTEANSKQVTIPSKNHGSWKGI